MKHVVLGPEFHLLLKYIIAYRRLRGRANARLIIEQLIVAYAKQLTTGMPEKLWRDNILVLINEAEQVQAKRLRDETERRKKLKKRMKNIGLHVD